ncbi:MAG: HAMP domain-containing protein [Kiritimatiellales bacterium]|nr:HAMP domain-containing protein [Kiritimatiellota bacterium]MBL7016842.1 HAMP domain-containing protein [Kiritimatiellales bacterium]
MFSRKNKTPRLSFGLRLSLIYTSVLCFALAVVLSVTYQMVRHIAIGRDHDLIQAQAGQYKALFEQGGINAISRYFNQQLGSTSEQMFVRVIDRNNQIHFITVSHPLWKIFDQKNTNLLSRVSFDKAHWDELFREGVTGSWIVGTTSLQPGLYLQVGRSTSESRLVLSHFRDTALRIILPAIVLSLLVGWLMTRSAVLPLRSLVETLRRILSTGDLQQRVPSHTQRGELGELTMLFNRMLDQNEKLIQVSRETLDNVAHDLRTPMTHLRNATERALLDSDADREVLQEALADCAEESEKITQMLDLLMDMAEADTGQMALKKEPVLLSELAGEVIEFYGFVAEENEVELKNSVPPDLSVQADRLRLRQCLINLIDNALKYSPKHTVITLAGSASMDTVELSITDQGIGMTSDELPRIWDRLYRGEQSRSTSGLGLGLSFVKTIVAAHGGRVDVQTRLNEGSTFTLHLPQQQAL